MGRKRSNRAALPRTNELIDDFYYEAALDTQVQGLMELTDDLEERRQQVQHLKSDLEILQEKDNKNQALIKSMSRELSELRDAMPDKERRLERLEEMIPKELIAQWRWKDDVDTAFAYNMPANCLLEKAYRGWQLSGTNPADSLCRVKSGNYTYEIDFKTMIQKNVATGKRRPVTRTVWSSSSSADIVERVELALEARTQAVLERDQMAHELEKSKKALNIHTQAEATLKAELQSSRKAAEQMETERDAAEALLKLREEDLAEVTKERNFAKQACTYLESRIAGCIDQLAGAQDAASKSRQEAAAAEASLTLLEDDLAHVTKERNLAKQACNDLESRIAGCIDQLAGAQDVASKSRQEAAAAEEKAKLAQQAMIEAEEVAAKTDAQFQDATSSWRTTLEFWKVTSAPLAVRLVDEVSLFKLACKLLPQLSHTQQFFEGAQSRCYPFQHLDIKSVRSIHNPCLWSQYTRARANMREMHRVFRIKPLPLQPAFTGLQPLLGDCFEPDVELNEVVLVHGCSQAAAETVIKEGFDIRLAGSVGGSMYGTGLYFAQEPCKACQYTGNGLRHLLVVRVTLGDCKYPIERYSGRLPPFRDEAQPEKGRVDALVVNPENSRRRQAHREFVVFDGKLAYPELLITYECP